MIRLNEHNHATNEWTCQAGRVQADRRDEPKVHVYRVVLTVHQSLTGFTRFLWTTDQDCPFWKKKSLTIYYFLYYMNFSIERASGFDIFWYIPLIVLSFRRNLNYCQFISMKIVTCRGRGEGERKREVKEDSLMKCYITLVSVHLVFKILAFDKIYLNVLFLNNDQFKKRGKFSYFVFTKA